MSISDVLVPVICFSLQKMTIFWLLLCYCYCKALCCWKYANLKENSWIFANFVMWAVTFFSNWSMGEVHLQKTCYVGSGLSLCFLSEWCSRCLLYLMKGQSDCVFWFVYGCLLCCRRELWISGPSRSFEGSFLNGRMWYYLDYLKNEGFYSVTGWMSSLCKRL